MPTGYTADVCDGKVTDFKKFAIRCAHAFGALVELRDEGMDAPIPEFKPSPYYEKAYEEAGQKLAEVRSMTDGECETEAKRDYRKAVEAHRESGEARLVVRGRLLAMRSKVSDWKPPTSEHQGLKDFMIQQLDETIRFDGTPSNFHLEGATKLTGAAWRRERIEHLERDVKYYAEEYTKEVERVKTRNEWVAALNKSL